MLLLAGAAAFVICAGAGLAAFRLIKRVLTPVKSQRQAVLFAVVETCDGAEGLEQVMRGLRRLEDSGTLRMKTVIAGSSLSAEGRRRAALAAERFGAVPCCSRDVSAVLEEMSRGSFS